jgi:hypothetical protein
MSDYDDPPGMYERSDDIPLGCVLACILSGLIWVLVILFAYWVWRWGITITNGNN